MHIYYTRKTAMLVAGLVISASFLIVAGAFASGNIPTPSIKPSLFKKQEAFQMTSSGIPIPPHKPSLEQANVIQVALANPKDLKTSSKPRTLMSDSVFSDKQARLYREIFDFQRSGNMKAADERISKLNNTSLMGHVLADRYLHPADYKASYKELQEWMRSYADYPQAKEIYKLALSTKKFGAKNNLKKPVSQKSISGNLSNVSKRAKQYRSTKKRSNSQQSRVQKLRRDVRHHVERKEPTLALSILSNDYAVQLMDNVEYDRLKALVASGYLYAGKSDSALRLSNEVLNRSGNNVPLAGWVSGLVHWKSQNYQKAAQGFEAAATSPYASGWMISAASYWASRSNKRLGNKKLVNRWLRASAVHPRTFYGLIATRALGEDGDFNWQVPSLTRDDVRYIEGTKKGKRAAALIKVGRLDLAEAELKTINPGRSVEKQKALLAYASYYRLPALSMRIGNAYSNPKGGLYDSALYPLVSWKPKNGYKIDRALLHAIIRQESRFHASASNPSGATGLMQLMPATANYVAGSKIYHSPTGQHQLKDPEVNLELGQTYIKTLLNHKSVGQDLMSLAIAYNAGPGNLSRWKSERSDVKDPLLFIETIPYNETRAFVERVLSNYWIYRMRLKQDTPSLDAVAKGQWARYAVQDKGLSKIATAN